MRWDTIGLRAYNTLTDAMKQYEEYRDRGEKACAAGQSKAGSLKKWKR